MSGFGECCLLVLVEGVDEGWESNLRRLELLCGTSASLGTLGSSSKDRDRLRGRGCIAGLGVLVVFNGVEALDEAEEVLSKVVLLEESKIEDEFLLSNVSGSSSVCRLDQVVKSLLDLVNMCES